MFNFYFLLLVSIIISIRFNSRFIIWLRLEINMLRFLPIISSGLNIELENSVKYFLIQRWASIIFLISYFFCSYFINSIRILLILSIFIKLGISPFHTWFISILKTCSLYILMLLSSLQKIIPLIILNNVFFFFRIFYFCIIITIIFLLIILSSVININKLLALSSLGNILWLISSNLLSLKLMILFLTIYVFLLMGIYLFYNSFYYNLFIQINRINFFDKIIIVLLFISLGGMPPLLGFLRKFLILKIIFIYENLILFLIIIFSSLVLLYHYMSRIYFFITFIPSLKTNFSTNNYSITKYFYLISVIIFNGIFFIL